MYIKLIVFEGINQSIKIITDSDKMTTDSSKAKGVNIDPSNYKQSPLFDFHISDTFCTRYTTDILTKMARLSSCTVSAVKRNYKSI